MKKATISLLILTIGMIRVSAQIGINTPNPQAPFHIDGNKDNPVTGVPAITQQANDVVITAQGRLGVGTTAPTNQLEVNSGTAEVSGITITQLPSATALATDANGAIISANNETVGVSVTKQRLTVPSSTVILNSGSGRYSFRYAGYNATTLLNGTWQIRINDGAARQFMVWDVEFNDTSGGTGVSAVVYRQRTVPTFTPGTWASLDGNQAGGSTEYTTYHIYDSSTGTIVRFTCTLSNMGTTTAGIREAMIAEEF
ncbi:hypothetical protein [Chryseobacterium populi]|uniref:Uncharacterized protein n=1 Tax=Chryseobacterium populi TaxID=1144316 RepID=J2K8S9_9FLAO|nr:hypothetical protein [Chryseobacterium populi]EJL69623.1 hypothetical protein PMI13_03196 [Chryseobacterium populi]